MSEPATDSPSEKLPPLPPVQPPSATFLFQLFVVPMVIVLIIVVVWLLFSWLAHIGSNPRDLVRDIAKVNDASWQRAYNLAELMRRPENDKLKDDADLAKELATTLTSLHASRPERKRDAKTETDKERKERKDKLYENRVQLEIFLCKVLGNFRVTEGLPALIEAAGPEPTDDPEGFAVRVAALGAIAVQAGELKTKLLRDDPKLMQTLLDCARIEDKGDFAKEEYAKLRSAAAFTLGMVGGQESLDQLHKMTTLADANTRYNAAIGLARHGDTRALPTLYEMLDPKNEEGLSDPDAGTAQAVIDSGRQWKRVELMSNALAAAKQLVAKHPDGDYVELSTRLKTVEASDTVQKIKLDARALRMELEKKK